MARLQRRQKKAPEIRRSEVLEAAKRCFREVGFDATKMSQVADSAGVSVGLIYRHFANKEDIIEAIIVEDLESQKKLIADALEAHPSDPFAAIGEIAKSFPSAILDFDRTALMVEIIAETVRNPKITKLAAQTRRELGEMFRIRVAAMKSPPMSAEEMVARLEVVAGLVTGVAIQLFKQTPAPGPLLLEVIEQAAKQIITPAKPLMPPGQSTCGASRPPRKRTQA